MHHPSHSSPAPPPARRDIRGSDGSRLAPAWTDLLRQRWRAMNAALPRREAWLFPAPWAWAVLGVLGVFVAAGFAVSSMRFVIDRETTALAITILVLLLAGLFHARRGTTWLAGLMLALAYFLLAGALGRGINYLVTALALPLQDELLDALHDLIGFDWQAHVRWLDERPALVQLLSFAYASHAWMIPLTILSLALTGRFARLREFLLLFSLAGFACMIIGGLVPALGTYGHYGLSPAGLAHIPDTGTSYLSDLVAVRAGALGDFVLREATGLTQFPSFHTVMALLFAHAWRGTRWQWPVRGLAVLIILATPVMGGHYLADLLGGAAVFLLTVRLLQRAGAADAAAGNLSSTVSGERANA